MSVTKNYSDYQLVHFLFVCSTMLLLRIICWPVIFMTRLQFLPGVSITSVSDTCKYLHNIWWKECFNTIQIPFKCSGFWTNNSGWIILVNTPGKWPVIFAWVKITSFSLLPVTLQEHWSGMINILIYIILSLEICHCLLQRTTFHMYSELLARLGKYFLLICVFYFPLKNFTLQSWTGEC